jgi:hypothetical protein
MDSIVCPPFWARLGSHVCAPARGVVHNFHDLNVIPRRGLNPELVDL